MVGDELNLKSYFAPKNSSGEQITSFNHFSGLTVANGRVYIRTYDGTLDCFGLDDSQRTQ